MQLAFLLYILAVFFKHKKCQSMSNWGQVNLKVAYLYRPVNQVVQATHQLVDFVHL